ncbi:hypothetical protein ACO0KY_08475 [Undibacterium sp. Dicai25W]|uniref:hypothetical protein n=1 Tax=Undibacterium sp. Dicai25W TaxID=3413034 RepID=UPI003BF42FAB
MVILRAFTRTIFINCILCFSAHAIAAVAAITTLDLSTYADKDGAISIQEHGDTIDPYFVLQALLLAHDHGLSNKVISKKWINWLIVRQKPDATFDRFCKVGPVWAPCKTADADDALLALWIRLLEALPEDLKTSLTWQQSRIRSINALSQLIDANRGIYLVSPVYQHGLFMDNLEVLSYQSTDRDNDKLLPTKTLENNIRRLFWDQQRKIFLVSTQAEQKEMASKFYPDQVAQIFPLLYRNNGIITTNRHQYYQQWMRRHRQEWLMQSREDFAWGLIAVIAQQEGDSESARCWMRDAGRTRHTPHWIVSDEVAWQILSKDGLNPAANNTKCL